MNRNRLIPILPGYVLLLLCASLAAAQDADPELFWISERFRAYEPNYGIIERTKDDERSIEAHYSFRYEFFGDHDTWSTFFSYTGEFDFYAQTRDSSPVVNRISNPALHYRINLNKRAASGKLLIRWWDIALEHLSNGQVIDVFDKVDDPGSPNHDRYVTQVELESGNQEYFDTLSRGSNFVSAEALFRVGNYDNYQNLNENSWSLSLWAKGKCFHSQSSEITWGPYVDRDVQIADYDRFRFSLSQRWIRKTGYFREIEVGFRWTVGDKWFKTDSQDYTLLVSVGGIDHRLPFYFRAHTGPNDIFSDYTATRRSFGAGFLLR
jgi:hypothetical protein